MMNKKKVEISFTMTVDCTLDVLLDVPDVPDCSTKHIKGLMDVGYIDWVEAVTAQHSVESIMKHSIVEHFEVLSVKIND